MNSQAVGGISVDKPDAKIPVLPLKQKSIVLRLEKKNVACKKRNVNFKGKNLTWGASVSGAYFGLRTALHKPARFVLLLSREHIAEVLVLLKEKSNIRGDVFSHVIFCKMYTLKNVHIRL